MRFTALAALSGLALVLFACSSEAPSGSVAGGRTPSSANNGGDDDGDSKDTRAGNTSGTSSSSGGTSTDTNPTTPAAGQCGASANQEACFECCDKAAPGAYQKLDTDWAACACAADKCGTQCAASVCAATPKDPQQGDACDTCLTQQGPACSQTAAAACEADANCKKVFACEESAKCFDKPE